jgi:hypothetical protein
MLRPSGKEIAYDGLAFLSLNDVYSFADAAGNAGQCCICEFISSAGGIMLAFKSDMIHSDPATTRVTMSTPNASASTLFVLSGPVVMCRKKTSGDGSFGIKDAFRAAAECRDADQYNGEQTVAHVRHCLS